MNLVLQFHAITVNKIVVTLLDMRIDNQNDATIRILNLLVHLSNVNISEVCRVPLEVFIALRVVILLSPLDIAPEHI